MINLNRIERIDAVTALEIKENVQRATVQVTLLHRGERVHSSECSISLLAQVIEDHHKIYASPEIIVKCSLCDDMWHTVAEVWDAEVCTDCGDVFEIQPEDVVSQEVYAEHCRQALDPQEIEFQQAKEES